MVPVLPKEWHDSFFESNNSEYLAELLLEMNSFFSKPENINKNFDASQAKANQGKDLHFGFAIEAAIELNFVYFNAQGLRLTLEGYELARLNDVTEIAGVITLYVNVFASDNEHSEGMKVPY